MHFEDDSAVVGVKPRRDDLEHPRTASAAFGDLGGGMRADLLKHRQYGRINRINIGAPSGLILARRIVSGCRLRYQIPPRYGA